MSSFRRTCVVLLGVAALAGLGLIPPAQAQKQPLPPQIDGIPAVDPGVNDFSQAISLPTDPKLERSLQAAIDNVKAENWAKVVEVLQGLLNIPEDKFVQVERTGVDGKKSKVWVSVRKESNRLIGTLPKDGMDTYKLAYGGEAKNSLAEAKQRNDFRKMADVANRYLYTDSGAEAMQLVASNQLDRGDFVSAALYFERLIEREELHKMSEHALIKSAIALNRFKDPASAKLLEKVWAAFKEKYGSSVRLGDKVVELGDLRSEVEKVRDGGVLGSKFDWAMVRGNPGRNGIGDGDAPFMKNRYKLSTVRDASSSSTTVRSTINNAVSVYANRGGVVIPAASPIATNGMLFYRATDGIFAIDLKSGEMRWNTVDSAKLSLTRLGEDVPKWNIINQWYGQFTGAGFPNIVFENSTISTLSTDNTNVYAVDDLPVPPFVQQFQQQPFLGPPELAKAAQGSKLQAYNIKSGKLIWELGAADTKSDKAGEIDLTETFFLGAPLPIHGKLYALAEKKEELKLLCIDPAHGEVNWSQPLANTNVPITRDPYRRTQAAHLAYGEGILVCPTNSGAVLGVDMLTHSLVWAYSYRPKQPGVDPSMPNPGGPFRPVPFPQPGLPVQPVKPKDDWKVSAPVITDGKVIFTAFDASGLHCLNLRDGSEIWKTNKSDDDLYLGGVHKGKVILVGKKFCRAVDVNTGKEDWKTQTGTPSGMGVIADNIFFLPLKAGEGKGEPEVCQINIDKGNILAHTKSRNKEVPGNLLFYDGDVLSQSLDEVAAYPQLKVQLGEMNALLDKNPNDPVGLKLRGEVNLDGGDHQGAIDDLQKALANKPDDKNRAEIRATLYDCLTEYMQISFPKAEKYIDVYADLCKVATAEDASPQDKQANAKEEKRRMATMYSLIGEGRKDQDKLVEAFDAYLAFGSLGLEGNELMPVVYDKSIRAPLDVLARAQINALMAKAVEKGMQKPLEDKIRAKWGTIKPTDIDSIRSFVSMFGTQSSVGRQARFQLAEQLMGEKGFVNMVEAERHLLLLRRQTEEPLLAAKALECLARLMTSKGQMRDAAYYFRALAEEYPKVKVRDDMTGEDLFNELITDKRFWGELDEGTQSWFGARAKIKTENGQFQQNQPQATLTFEPVGEVTPFFQRLHVSLSLQFNHLRIVDRVTGEEVLKATNLTRVQDLANIVNMFPQGQGPRFTYHIMGHMMVLPVGYMVYGIDLVAKRQVWEKNMLGDGGMIGVGGRLQPDPADGTLSIIYQDGYTQPLGKVGPIEPSYVCVQGRDSLTALDPITGRTLWVRDDISSRAQLFGDEQMIYAVEMNTQKQPTGTRCLRAHDGASLPAADFTGLFQQRQRVIGRTILVSDAKADKMVLRLYDVLTGKDLWAKEFPTGTLVLKSEEPNLVGGIDPQGKFTVFDLRTQKEVLKGQLDAAHVAKCQHVTLLEDGNQFYLAVQGPPNQQVAQFGANAVRSNFTNNTGVRSVPVNGYVYAFSKDGTLKWRTMEEIPNQMLVMEGFKELPFLLFSCQATKMMGNPQQGQWAAQVGAIHVINKKTGKLEMREPEMNPNNPQQFFSYNLDLKAGKLEMVSWGYKLTLNMEMETASDKK